MLAKRVGPVVLVLALAACGSSRSTTTAATSASAGSGSGLSGLVAVGSAKQTVPADLAFVVVEPDRTGGSIGFPPSSTPPTKASRADLRGRLRALGLPDGAFHMDGDPSSFGSDGETTLRVEVPVAKLPKIATDVSKAIDAVMGTKNVAGLRFAVEDCTGALSTARTDAIKDARRAADALALAAHVELGELRDVSEGPSDAISAAYIASLGSGQPCGRSSVEELSIISSYGTPPQPLDAKPEVELTFAVSATFALPDVGNRTLIATGTGEVSGKADRAEIVVAPSPFSGSSSGAPFASESSTEPFTTEDRDRITRAITALGVRENDLEIETQAGRWLYVSAQVSVDVLHENGTKIVDAVKGDAGPDVASGVLFISSACHDLVAKARTRALTDADARLAALANAANARSGALVGLSEPQGSFSPFATQVDPCEIDLDAPPFGGELAAILNGNTSGTGVPKFEAIDAEPKVTQRVSVTEVRAING